MFARITIKNKLFPSSWSIASTSHLPKHKQYHNVAGGKMSKFQMFDSVTLNQDIQINAGGIVPKEMTVGL